MSSFAVSFSPFQWIMCVSMRVQRHWFSVRLIWQENMKAWEAVQPSDTQPPSFHGFLSVCLFAVATLPAWMIRLSFRLLQPVILQREGSSMALKAAAARLRWFSTHPCQMHCMHWLDESLHQMAHDTVSVNMSDCQTPMQLSRPLCLPVTPYHHSPFVSPNLNIFLCVHPSIINNTITWSAMGVSVNDEMSSVWRWYGCLLIRDKM